MNLFNYYIIYKPFGMMPQFKDEAGRPTLADLPFEFPKDVYPVGRLDKDSEGLLILTNDKKLNHKLLNPEFRHKRTYWVQVEGIPTDDALTKLRSGVTIRVNKKDHRTRRALAELIPEPSLPERDPPIRFRKSVPDRWIELALTEGKNRQVRRMTAAVGYPTLRLVRSSIEGISIGNMQPAEVIELDRKTMYTKLGIK